MARAWQNRVARRVTKEATRNHQRDNRGSNNREDQATLPKSSEKESAADLADNGDSSQSLDDQSDQSIEAPTTLSSHSRHDQTIPSDLPIRPKLGLSDLAPETDTDTTSTTAPEVENSDSDDSSERPRLSTSAEASDYEGLAIDGADHALDGAKGQDRTNELINEMSVITKVTSKSPTLLLACSDLRSSSEHLQTPDNTSVAGSAELERTATETGNQVTNGANEDEDKDELASERSMTGDLSSSPHKSTGLRLRKRLTNARRRTMDRLRQGVAMIRQPKTSVKLAGRRAVDGLCQVIAILRQPKRALGELLDFILINEDDIAKFITHHPKLTISVLRAIEYAARGTLIGIQTSRLLAKAIWKVSQVSYTAYQICSPTVALMVVGLLRYMRDKLIPSELETPVGQGDDDHVGAVATPAAEHWLPFPQAPSLLDEIKALTRVGEHTRYDFGQSNHDKHPFSTIIDVPRPNYITNMQAFELYRDIQFRLEELGRLRRIPAILGAKFEVIPFDVQAIFSEPFANIDGQIIRSEDVWDFPIRGIDLPSRSQLSVIWQRNDSQLHTYVGVAISMSSSTGQRNYTYAWFKQPTIQVEHRESVDSMEGVQYTG